MSEETGDKIARNIPLTRFWIIKGALIFCFALSFAWLGYYIGTYKVSLKVDFAKYQARQEILAENTIPGKVLSLVSSGSSFCYNQGNIWPAKIRTRKNRSLMPYFVTLQPTEF